MNLLRCRAQSLKTGRVYEIGGFERRKKFLQPAQYERIFLMGREWVVPQEYRILPPRWMFWAKPLYFSANGLLEP